MLGTSPLLLLSVFAVATVRAYPAATPTSPVITDSSISFPSALPTFVFGDGNLGKELGGMLGNTIAGSLGMEGGEMLGKEFEMSVAHGLHEIADVGVSLVEKFHIEVGNGALGKIIGGAIGSSLGHFIGREVSGKPDEWYGTVAGGLAGKEIGVLVGIAVGKRVTTALENYAASHHVIIGDPDAATNIGAEIGQSFGDYLGKVFTHVKSGSDGQSLGAVLGHQIGAELGRAIGETIGKINSAIPHISAEPHMTAAFNDDIDFFEYE